jgi:hypothetical protein
MTHSLGFRYLWIGSFCIIQDSKEDLDREIRSMDRIYQNATLTIFAAGADDVDSGLRFSRNAQETKPCQLNIKFTAGSQTSDITTLVTFYTDRVPSGHYPLFDRWYDMVENYCMRSLSYRRDVLPALNGLSNAMGGRTNLHLLMAYGWRTWLAVLRGIYKKP